MKNDGEVAFSGVAAASIQDVGGAVDSLEE
jgi:hypothetical protein